MSNYKALFGLKVLKDVLISFTESFLVLYFLEVSQSNILPLGVYKLVNIITIYVVIFLLRNFCKSKYRVNLLRIGIILDFIYFLTIILLKERIVDYMYLVGLLYGLEEGFYFSVYNTLESDGVRNEERTKFLGSYMAIKSILVTIFPLIFGSSINTVGFTKSLIIVLLIILLRIILSFIFKDTNIPKSKKTNLIEYHQIVKKEKTVRQIYKMEFFCGLTYSEGALTYIITIFIIKIFSNSFSLGIFTSIFAIISSILGMLFAKFIKKEQHKSIIKISVTFTIISLLVMIYRCNMTTVIMFNLFQTFSRTLMNMINQKVQYNTANLKAIQKEYKVEYWIGNETALFLGRVISHSLFILMAFTDSNLILYIFILFLILYARNSIKLQEVIKE